MKKIISGVVVVLTILILGVVFHYYINKSEEKFVDNNPTGDNVTVQNLKDEYGATGNNDLYQVTEEFDGRKILTVKPEIEFNVALAGVLNNNKPELDNLNSTINNMSIKNGIWISDKSRDKLIKMLNELTVGEYYVDNSGYLQIKSEGNNDYDNALKKIINGEKTIFVDIKGNNYIVDSMNGEISENPFEDMDPYQSYEYYKIDNKILVILTTNKKRY